MDRDSTFYRFYSVLPKNWQWGLHEALNGGAWSGDLVNKKDGQTESVIVYFVHPSLASKVDAALKGDHPGVN